MSEAEATAKHVPRSRTASPSPSGEGILLVGHGTRNELGNQEFCRLAEALATALSPRPVVTCYLELRQPDIQAGLRELRSRGVCEIVLAPILLFEARHSREDIPAEAAKFLAEFPDVKLRHSGVLRGNEKVRRLAFERARSRQGWEFDCCIVVARGTSDPIAQREIEQYVESQRPGLAPILGKCSVSLAYVAAAEPRLADALAAAVRSGSHRILLLPQILFHGEVLSEIRHLAEQAAASRPDIEVVVADHLGAGLLTGDQSSHLLAEAFWDRIQETWHDGPRREALP